VAITKVAARFLMEARESGVNFDRTLTLGRQGLLTSPLWLARELAARGHLDRGQRSAWARRISRRPYVADELYTALGARQLDVLDNSDYEGASVIHDLNKPVPDRLHSSFDVVFDGGSLEHVFEFPTALRSVMSMVKAGGHLIVGTPTNNLSGHGFYQFSPEVFYRALGPQSGFKVERMVVVEYDQVTGTAFGRLPFFAELVGAHYEVKDSVLKGGRQISFTSRNPTMLFVRARRVAERPLLADAPQQGVWAAQWNEHDEGSRVGAELATSAPGPAPTSRRGPDPETSGIPPGVTVRVFHLLFAGFGSVLRPFRGLLFRIMSRRRALGHQSEVVRRLPD
jgi:hypothetical protein